MKRIFSFVLAAAIVLQIPAKCSAFSVSAKSAVLIETGANRIIFEKNSQEKLPMASTTKIMTAICALENTPQLDKKVRVADAAVGTEGSSIYLKCGESLTVRELIYGLMLNSGNDAAIAIAYAVCGDLDKFVELMNDTARKIGALNTSFKNPNGLDENGHYTTAADLALIASYALKNEEFKNIVSTYRKNIPYEGYSYERQLKNHNKMLKMYDGCVGVKTGFTKKSGRCLVSAAERGGAQLVAVTLNAPDDWNDHINMLNFGFENVMVEKVISKGMYLKTVPVKGGNEKSVKIVSSGDVNVCRIHSDKNSKITVKLNIKSSLIAPVNYSQVVGKAEVFLNGKKVGQTDAITENLVIKDEQKSFFRSAALVLYSFFDVSSGF